MIAILGSQIPTNLVKGHHMHRTMHSSDIDNSYMRQSPYSYWLYTHTFGPQRRCFVAQQISVLHMTQRIQSQPSFFCTMILHCGQFIASPFSTRSCNNNIRGFTFGLLMIIRGCVAIIEAVGNSWPLITFAYPNALIIHFNNINGLFTVH